MPKPGEPLIPEGALVLFQGDSVTDCGRKFDGTEDLGAGYVPIIAGWCAAVHPCRKLNFVNRGIGGDTVKELKARWKEDCLDIRPAWVSILIGVNGCLRPDAGDFEVEYRDILSQTRDTIGSRLVLMEPFIIPSAEDRRIHRGVLEKRIDIVRNLAAEYGAILVPLDKILNKACTVKPPAWWAGDGLHPTTAGNTLIARSWLEATGLLG